MYRATRLVLSYRNSRACRGENIPSGKKSIALKVTIQSDHKTLNENDLTDISKMFKGFFSMCNCVHVWLYKCLIS